VTVQWIDEAGRIPGPGKPDKADLDACICLLVALYLAQRKDCLMVGDRRTGCIVVLLGAGLPADPDARSKETGRVASERVWVLHLTAALINGHHGPQPGGKMGLLGLKGDVTSNV